jgi:ubiquinone/menaquinone biosynthesis C-methylase UbiE
MGMRVGEVAVLDPCCGSRMFWFDKQDQRVLFGDIRSEQHTLCDGRALNITPDIAMDFRAMPFADESFKLIVFDPPHLTRCGPQGWMGKKYGILGADWREDIRRGFAECFRVLATDGVLIFKWADVQVPVSELLKLTPHKPLFGHKSGKREKTHWMTFMKEPK